MSKAFLFILSLSVLSGFIQPDPGKGIQWDKTEVNFDTIEQGMKLRTRFTCYNRSDSSLIFENLQASCGCVASRWQKTPIAPGDSSVITVDFDTKGKSGRQHRIIAVYSNQGMFELNLYAFVEKKGISK
ncbi:MAG TPA: DUF1573 domain-containing protein [Bacteroidia bacterium]